MTTIEDKALALVSEDHRLTATEIAERLGCTVSAVSKALHNSQFTHKPGNATRPADVTLPSTPWGDEQ